MRAPGFRAALWLVGLAMAGCGGFENAPLERGMVRGRILGAESGVARVSVLGQSELSTGVQPDGRFELTEVPATSLELFVVASRTHAVRVPVVAQGARITDVGDIRASPGAFITVHVVDTQGQVPPGAEVEIDATGLDEHAVDATSGQVRVGPLPAGCYELTVKAEERESVKLEVCVQQGEEAMRSVTLPPPEGDEVVDGGESEGSSADPATRQ